MIESHLLEANLGGENSQNFKSNRVREFAIFVVDGTSGSTVHTSAVPGVAKRGIF